MHSYTMKIMSKYPESESNGDPNGHVKGAKCFRSAGRPRTAFRFHASFHPKRHDDVSHSQSFAKSSNKPLCFFIRVNSRDSRAQLRLGAPEPWRSIQHPASSIQPHIWDTSNRMRVRRHALRANRTAIILLHESRRNRESR